MSADDTWQTMSELASEWGQEVSAFLLAMSNARPCYNTHDGNLRWTRGEMFVWLGRRMMTTAAFDAKLPDLPRRAAAAGIEYHVPGGAK